MIDTSSKYIDFFELRGRVLITRKGGEKGFLFGGIPFSSHNSFSVRIIKTLDGDVAVGAVLPNKKQMHSDNPHRISYSGYDGEVWIDGREKVLEGGRSLKDGDKMDVLVDSSKGEI